MQPAQILNRVNADLALFGSLCLALLEFFMQPRDQCRGRFFGDYALDKADLTGPTNKPDRDLGRPGARF